MPAALAASSILRCVSRAAMASSCLRSNLAPWPFTGRILAQSAAGALPRSNRLSDYQQISLACFRDRSDECHRHGKPWEREHLHETFTIDADNNITTHTSRKAARETGAGVFATEEQFADLIGPDNKRLVEIWNGLTGVKPVTKFANRKSATERIWKAIQSLGEQAASPVPETPFSAIDAEAAPCKLPVAGPEQADAWACL